jgi:hypothetical protein
MAWDPALLRKYNTTSHFRLLNQIRSELREQPIQRPLVTSRSAAGFGGGGGRRGGRGGAGSTPVASSRAPLPVTAPEPASAAQTAAGSGHSTTRRRSTATRGAQPGIHEAPRDHQPIVAVPVLTDVVMPDSHTGT